MIEVVPRLRKLVAELSQRKLGLSQTLVRVGFVVDKVANAEGGEAHTLAAKLRN
jgi:hypothetical protein